jgi:hypothetical protein
MKCTAHKTNGTPCKANAIKGSNVCRVHGGSAPQVKAKAQQRLLAAADDAAAVLVQIIMDESKPDNVRVTAIKDLLDRAGLKPVEQIEVKPVDESVIDREIARLLKDIESL